MSNREHMEEGTCLTQMVQAVTSWLLGQNIMVVGVCVETFTSEWTGDRVGWRQKEARLGTALDHPPPHQVGSFRP